MFHNRILIQNVRKMLRTIGKDKLADLFNTIPEAYRYPDLDFA